MKNLKKVAALVLVLAMALSSVAFAGYTDVAEDANYAEAVEVMSALGLLKGYEDGTFGPDKTITRAEFAAVIVRALGMEDAAAGAVANTMFADVTSAHWAAGYVQIANQQGIIAGYGDGTFGPDDEVTYEQAVKMIVCALGYGIKFAGVENAYPTAYLSQANTSGITVGATGKIGEKATRATVAKLVYNALDVKLMEQTGFGTDTKFEEVNKTLLSSKLNVVKAEAEVGAFYFEPAKADQINLNVTKMSDIYCAAMNLTKGDKGYDLASADVDRDYYVAEGVELVKGYSYVAYIDISGDESDWTVVAMAPKAGKNNTLVLEAANTKGAGVAKVGEKALEELKYFKNNAEVDLDTTKIKLDDVKIFKNKDVASLITEEFTNDSFIDNWNKGAYNEITLIDNDNDNKYEYIYVTGYESWVVTDIYESRNRIKGTINGTTKNITLDPEDEVNSFTITDVNGNVLAFADVKVGDVLNIFKSTGSDGELTEVVVSNDKVEGTVTEWNEAASKYTIGDNAYVGTKGQLKVSDTGVFTVDMYGKIIDFELDASNRKFGMLYQIYVDDSGADDEPKAIILTAAGEFETYSFYKKVDFNGAKDTAKTSIKEEKSPALVMYTTNSSNEITKIYKDAKIAEVDDKYTVAATPVKDKEFDAASSDINGLILTDASVIFTCKEDTYATADRANNYGIASKAYFADEEKYTYTAITDENDEIVLAVVFGAVAQVNKASIPMYVTSVGEGVDANGDEATIVKGYVDGDLVELVVPADCDGDTAKIAKGCVMQFAGEGEAIAVKVLVTADDIKDPSKFAEVKSEDGEKDGYYAYAGTVKKIANNKYYFEDGKTVTFDTGISALFVRLDSKEIKNVVANKLYAGDVETTESEGVKSDDYIIIYKYDNDAIGAVIIDVNGDTKI